LRELIGIRFEGYEKNKIIRKQQSYSL